MPMALWRQAPSREAAFALSRALMCLREMLGGVVETVATLRTRVQGSGPAGDQQLVSRCPACDEPIFANVVFEIGEPINLCLPVYLVNVVLTAAGKIASYEYQGDGLLDSIDLHAADAGYEPGGLDIYCDDGHDVVALLRAQPRRFVRGDDA